MLSYAQLTTPTTETEAQTLIIQRLSELGFSSKGWQSGSVQLTLVKLVAWLYAQFTTYVAAIVTGLFNDTSSGELLTRFSDSHYDNQRQAATSFVYRIRHTVEVGSGPHTVEVGDIVISNGVHLYRNIEAGTLTSAGVVYLNYQAEIVGSGPNAAQGTITTLVTSVAGLSVINPDSGPVVAGVDEETDDELRLRNTTKWATLSIDMPSDGYENVVLEAVPAIGRIKIDASNPRGPGTLDIYVAGPTGEAGDADVDAAQVAVDARRSVTADVLVKKPTLGSLSVSGQIYIAASIDNAEGHEAIEDAIRGYVEAIPIGGEPLTDSTSGIDEAGVKAAIRGVTGVKNVNLGMASDVLMTSYSIAAANITVTYVVI